MKLLYKIFHINTLTKKVALIIIFIGTILFLIINLILSNIFYAMFKRFTISHTATLLEETAYKISYVLVVNGTSVGRFKGNVSLAKLLMEYDKQTVENKAEIKQEIQEHKLISTVTTADLHAEFSSAIVSDKGDIFCKSEDQELVGQFYSSYWYQYYRKHLAKDGRRIYGPVRSSGEGKKYIFYINTKVIDNKIYDFIIIENFDQFEDIFSSLESANIENYLLLGLSNEILYSNLANSDVKLESIPKTAFEGRQFQSLIYENEDGADFVIRASAIDEGLKMVVHTTKDALIYPYKPIILFIKSLFGISFVLFIISICVILKGSMKNLKFLSEQMLKVRGGDYFVKVDINSADEVEMLGHTFNMMMDEIRNYIDKVIGHEKNVQKMQYTILISEIDPHLIYNTLNTITYLARLKRTEDIVLVNNALISMLKDRLKIKGYESFDSLKIEMEVVNQYMIIQNYLYGDSIKLKWEVTDDLLQEKIPKNVIQPLVENALFHGMLANKDDDGEIIPGVIVVSLIKKEDRLHLCVKDSGVGMSKDKVNEYFISSADIHKSKGENIGIKNIRMRLKYLYDERAEVKVESKVSMGTSIEILVPSETK